MRKCLLAEHTYTAIAGNSSHVTQASEPVPSEESTENTASSAVVDLDPDNIDDSDEHVHNDNTELQPINNAHSSIAMSDREPPSDDQITVRKFCRHYVHKHELRK